MRILQFGRSMRGRVMLVAAAVAAVALASAGSAFAAGHTLYVSPSGSDGNACTQNAPCQTISHAVWAAGPHSTIMVGPGTYTEEVTITKTLNLEGDNAIIDATGIDRGIVIAGAGSAGTMVSGFTVENATFEGIRAIDTSHVTIENNVVQNNDQGAFSPNPTGECQPQGQVPGDCGEGLRLLTVSHSRVANNTVTNNVGGILVTDEIGPTFDNTIIGNTVTDNIYDCGITLPSHNGAAMDDPSLGGIYDNRIIGNLSKDNGGAGVGMFAAFPGAASYNNVVVGNTLTGDGEGGVVIHSHTPNQNVSGNVIANNTIFNNGTDPDSGSPGANGISMLSPVDPQSETIVANQISDQYVGIFIAGDFTINGLQSNKFDSSVDNPILP